MKCFYYSETLGGRCSAAIIKNEYTDCEMVGIRYGIEFPWKTIKEDETIFMVDFSLPLEEMVELNKICDFIWINNQDPSTVDERYKNEYLSIEGQRRTGTSSCILVWKFLYPKRTIPYSVQLLSNYDIGDYTNPGCISFQYGMEIEDTLPDSIVWHKVLSHWRPTFMNRKILEGEAIQKYLKTKEVYNGKQIDHI